MWFTSRAKATVAHALMGMALCSAQASAQTPNELNIPGGTLTLNGWKVSAITADGTRALYRSPVNLMAKGYRRMWERWEYLVTQTDVQPPYRSDIQYIEFDCDGRRMHSLQRNTFTGINMTGRVGFSSTQASSWDFVPPGTIADGFLETACKLRATSSKMTLSFPNAPPLTHSSIHNAVTTYRRIQSETGVNGARAFSEDCFAKLSTSPSWSKLDICIAFDSAAGMMDEAYTNVAKLPKNAYFSNDDRDGRALEAIQKMTDDRAVYIDRITKLRREVPPALNEAYDTRTNPDSR